MRKTGFTLIELLIVIAIILILIAIALPNFLEAQIRAKVARAAGDIRSIATAQEGYYNDWKNYTHDCHAQSSISTPGGGPDFLPGCLSLTTPIKYITGLPLDPFGLHKSTGGSDVDSPIGMIPYYPMGTGMNPSTEQRRVTRYTPPFTRDNPHIREAYIVYSAGPSSQEPGNPTRTFPLVVYEVPHPGTGAYWAVYAPTNGTNSFGGIIRVGGVRLEHPLLQHLNRLHN